jgi:hypothetical protein
LGDRIGPKIVAGCFCSPCAETLIKKKRDAPSVTKGKGQAARMRKVGFRSKLNIRLRQERLEQLATLPIFGEGMKYSPSQPFGPFKPSCGDGDLGDPYPRHRAQHLKQ